MPLSRNSFRFLIIEDNPADAILLKECISSTMIIVACIDVAATFADALRLLTEKEYDLLFLDLSLPDVIREEIVETLRKHSGNTPIIVVSGMDDQELALKTITCGA
ncbi:hypothetical protein BH09BAC5_BH09BAC5_01930 [soil metagenome]